MSSFDIYIKDAKDPDSPNLWWPLYETNKPLIGVDGQSGSSVSTLVAAGEIGSGAYLALREGRIPDFLDWCRTGGVWFSIGWFSLPAAQLVNGRRKIGYTAILRAKLERYMGQFLATSGSGAVWPLKEAIEQDLLADGKTWVLRVDRENRGFANKGIPERYISTDSVGCRG